MLEGIVDERSRFRKRLRKGNALWRLTLTLFPNGGNVPGNEWGKKWKKERKKKKIIYGFRTNLLYTVFFSFLSFPLAPSWFFIMASRGGLCEKIDVNHLDHLPLYCTDDSVGHKISSFSDAAILTTLFAVSFFFSSIRPFNAQNFLFWK